MTIKLKTLARSKHLKHDGTALLIGNTIKEALRREEITVLDFEEVSWVSPRFASLVFSLSGLMHVPNLEDRVKIDNCDFNVKDILLKGLADARLKKGL